MTDAYLARTRPDAVRFECCGCGACCHNWGVPVDAPSRLLIERHLKDHPHPKWGTALPTMVVDDNEILKLIDGGCAYLTEDNLCWLHREFGPEVKPIVCRNYPRRHVATPIGGFTTLTFSCHTAAGYLAQTVDDGRLPAEIPMSRPSTLPDIQLAPGIPLAPPLFERISNTFQGIIDRGDISVAARLCAVDSIARELRRHLEDKDGDAARATLHRATTQLPTIPPAPPTTEHLQMMRVILRHRRTFLVPGAVVQETIHRLIATIDEAFAIEDENARPPASIRLNRALTRHWTPASHVTEPILGRYVSSQFWSSHFTCAFGVQSGIRVIAFLVAVIRVYATALAVHAGEPVSAAHLVAAITDVEREFTHANVIMDFWKEILANPICDKEWLVPLLVL